MSNIWTVKQDCCSSGSQRSSTGQVYRPYCGRKSTLYVDRRWSPGRYRRILCVIRYQCVLHPWKPRLERYCIRLLFKHFGCDAILLFKHFGCKQNFAPSVQTFWMRRKTFVQSFWAQSKTFVQRCLMQSNTFVQTFWVRSKTFVQTFWMRRKTFVQTFLMQSKTFALPFWVKSKTFVKP